MSERDRKQEEFTNSVNKKIDEMIDNSLNDSDLRQDVLRMVNGDSRRKLHEEVAKVLSEPGVIDAMHADREKLRAIDGILKPYETAGFKADIKDEPGKDGLSSVADVELTDRNGKTLRLPEADLERVKTLYREGVLARKSIQDALENGVGYGKDEQSLKTDVYFTVLKVVEGKDSELPKTDRQPEPEKKSSHDMSMNLIGNLPRVALPEGPTPSTGKGAARS